MSVYPIRKLFNLQRILKYDESIDEVAQEIGVSVTTFFGWVNSIIYILEEVESIPDTELLMLSHTYTHLKSLINNVMKVRTLSTERNLRYLLIIKELVSKEQYLKINKKLSALLNNCVPPKTLKPTQTQKYVPLLQTTSFKISKAYPKQLRKVNRNSSEVMSPETLNASSDDNQSSHKLSKRLELTPTQKYNPMSPASNSTILWGLPEPGISATSTPSSITVSTPSSDLSKSDTCANKINSKADKLFLDLCRTYLSDPKDRNFLSEFNITQNISVASKIIDSVESKADTSSEMESSNNPSKTKTKIQNL